MPVSAIRRKPKSRWKVLAVAATLLLLLVGWLGTANYLAWAVMTDVQAGFHIMDQILLLPAI